MSCRGGPRCCISRTTPSCVPGPGPAHPPRGLGRTCTTATRLSAAYLEQANVRTDSGRACSRRVAQASDDDRLNCKVLSIVA
jgi:hypothetical protein